MYETYWGFEESPFRNLLDDSWFYESPSHEEVLARLHFLVDQQRLCGLLAGPRGTGKSLLLSVFVKQLRRSGRLTAVVDLCGVSGEELLQQLAEILQLAPVDSDSQYVLWRSLREHLRGLRLSQVQSIFIFDHLDQAEPDCESILQRLLCINIGSECWCTSVIAGPERLPDWAGSTLAELSDLRIELTPLSESETSDFVKESLQRAGRREELFEADALASIFELSGGVPRLINRLCDLSLLAGWGDEARSIDAATVVAVADQLQLNRPARSRFRNSADNPVGVS